MKSLPDILYSVTGIAIGLIALTVLLVLWRTTSSVQTAVRDGVEDKTVAVMDGGLDTPAGTETLYTKSEVARQIEDMLMAYPSVTIKVGAYQIPADSRYADIINDATIFQGINSYYTMSVTWTTTDDGFSIPSIVIYTKKT